MLSICVQLNSELGYNRAYIDTLYQTIMTVMTIIKAIVSLIWNIYVPLYNIKHCFYFFFLYQKENKPKKGILKIRSAEQSFVVSLFFSSFKYKILFLMQFRKLEKSFKKTGKMYRFRSCGVNIPAQEVHFEVTVFVSGNSVFFYKGTNTLEKNR